MATKTVINCTDHSIVPLNQGISIIIDDQQPSESKLNHTDFEYSPHSTNIIKIQHSSASTFQQSSPQLLTLSSSSTTLLNNNKTLIDINRNNDQMAKDPLNDHVLQINCTTSNEISKEIHLTKENSNIKLESNGFSELGIQNGIENEHNHHVEHNEQENVIGKEIVNDDDRDDDDEEKEFTKYNQHNFNSPEEVVEESGQTTSQQQKPPQHQQVNNGNSKYRENGQNSSTKCEHNQQHNNEDHSNNDHDHNDDLDHNEVTSLGDDQVNISANTLKRVMMVGSSHGKRSFSEENSNSLLTKADATTTSATTTLTINELIENHTNTKQNLENLKENHNHVVKIQIKPNELKTEKQVTVVKIENPQKPQENQEKVKKENLEILENIPNIEIKQEESVKITEKMVQKPSNSSTQSVTVSNNTHSSTTTGNATVSNTGATTVTELNVSNPNYLYYMMSSGQFSPCDTLDSGTGSDLESNGQPQQQQPSQQQQQSSANLSTKKSSNNTTIKPLEMHIKTTKIRVTNSSKTKETQQRQCSFTDSEESEASSLSCDSLHSNEFLRQQSASPMESPNTNNKKIQSFLPDSLLREIKNLKFSSTDYEAENEEEDDILPQLNKSKPKSSSALYESDNHYEPINTQDYQQSDYVKTRNNINNCSMSSSLKRASLPSKTFVINQEDGTFIDTKMNSMPRKYEADKYYNFHVNEHDNFRSFGNNSSSSLSSPNGDGDSFSISDFDTKSLHDDVFAGYKDIRCSSNTSTIRSSKGTVRGVKNRVRNGIATFLQLQQPNVKNFKEKDSGKVVLYTTSMGIIRDTYAKCSNVKQILRTLLVKFEERDVFMSVEYQQEIKERMHSEIIKVPQLYVEGQHIGDADTVERLNESGELRQLLKPYKSISTTYTCQTCGGYRLLPCPSCNGSKKSVHRNHFTAEFVALKCMNCDEVGLVKCHNC